MMATPFKFIEIEKFDEFVNLPENADRRFEYIGGEIVELPSNPYSSAIASNIIYFIQQFMREHGIGGFVTTEAGGYMVSGERYAPDVAFISKAKQDALARHGYNPTPPELAVEVISPSDSPNKLSIKISNYLAAGVVVWTVDPDEQTVAIHSQGNPTQSLSADGVISGGDVLPGFELPVKAIFAE
jgi:Uma2 family endonuclease